MRAPVMRRRSFQSAVTGLCLEPDTALFVHDTF
jgi:hypothetical protein